MRRRTAGFIGGLGLSACGNGVPRRDHAAAAVARRLSRKRKEHGILDLPDRLARSLA